VSGRKIEDLSRLDGEVDLLFERTGKTAGATLRKMDNVDVRFLDGSEGMPGMSLMSARFPIRRRTEALGGWLHIAIRGRGFARVLLFFSIWASSSLTRI
jgi:hypothetical protein